MYVGAEQPSTGFLFGKTHKTSGTDFENLGDSFGVS